MNNYKETHVYVHTFLLEDRNKNSLFLESVISIDSNMSEKEALGKATELIMKKYPNNVSIATYNTVDVEKSIVGGKVYFIKE